jgi:hypothetical protein
MPMRREFRTWRAIAARQIREIRRLARVGRCREANALKKELYNESVPSLVDWPTYVRLANDVGRRCARRGRKR